MNNYVMYHDIILLVCDDMCMKSIYTSRFRDGKRTETRIWMEGICITHSCTVRYNCVASTQYAVECRNG